MRQCFNQMLFFSIIFMLFECRLLLNLTSAINIKNKKPPVTENAVSQNTFMEHTKSQFSYWVKSVILQAHKQNHLFHRSWRSEARRGSVLLAEIAVLELAEENVQMLFALFSTNHPAGLVFPVADSAVMSEFYKGYL